MREETVTLGNVYTVGDLRKRLSAFTDECSISFDTEVRKNNGKSPGCFFVGLDRGAFTLYPKYY
jgi:hypothetical protein